MSIIFFFFLIIAKFVYHGSDGDRLPGLVAAERGRLGQQGGGFRSRHYYNYNYYYYRFLRGVIHILFSTNTRYFRMIYKLQTAKKKKKSRVRRKRKSYQFFGGNDDGTRRGGGGGI